MFLDDDANGDGDTKNDETLEDISITQSAARIEIEFGPYDELMKKNIMISLEDDNGNI